jgi:hypothetical protein
MTTTTMRVVVGLWLSVALCAARPVNAQGRAVPRNAPAPAPARTGKLIVTVQDSTGGVLPGADVTIRGTETATMAASVPAVKATDKGVATFENLTPGRYAIDARFPGFERATAGEVRVRAGDNKQTLTLALSRIEDAVTVGVDRQEAAADRALTFGNALTREQIDALSEDADELRAQLMNMAGDPNATIRVDSFEGQQLPPKAMIKSIRISRDQFSAENHYAGGISIEIITQPGVGPLRGNARLGYYDSALDGRNPLVGTTPPAQNRNVGAGLNGTLAKNRASFSINVNSSNNYTTNPLYYHDASGLVAGNTIRTLQRGNSGSGTLDYAVTRDHTIRTGLSFNRSHNDDAGIGGFNLPERAYSTSNNGGSFRLQEVGPLGRRFFTNTRLSMNWSSSQSQSALDALAINVIEAFNSGGAQQRGRTRSRNLTLASDLDYIRGRHSVRAGVLLEQARYNTNAISNYLGTYTFESLDAFEADRPRSFTQRIGDPNIQYSNLQAAFYLLDDFKLRKNFTLTAGLRYEAQTHLDDHVNLGPRLGITWAPFKSGKTTLRASWGIFYDWLSTGIYEQSIRLDGTHQQQVNIANPTFPDPGAVTALPTDKYLLSPGMQMPRTSRISLAASQTLSTRVQINASYSDSRGDNLFVGRNLNAPVNGVRPDPAFVNVVEVISAAASRQRSLSTGFSLNLARANDARNTSLIAWSRNLRLSTGYTIASARDNTSGAFSLPATGSIADDWGPSNGDTRQRGYLDIYTGILRNFTATMEIYANSARPLNITTGTDDNGDLLFTDRPAGVGRNSARAGAQWNTSAYFGYSFALGKRTVNSGGGVSITQVNGILTANTGGGQAVPRYRLSITANVQNLTNHANYGGYSGVMTSPFFLQPITAQGTRRVTFSANVSF